MFLTRAYGSPHRITRCWKQAKNVSSSRLFHAREQLDRTVLVIASSRNHLQDGH
ncbi:hypothetical protein Mapa_004743 [Marchantia paleacea]|nr:hypothetical protein Mapa_004743 [Marchantia paleacea]